MLNRIMTTITITITMIIQVTIFYMVNDSMKNNEMLEKG